jgi:hypothetical protein
MEDEISLDDALEVQKVQSDEDIEEAKRLKGRDLDDALYAALLSRAHSDQARALVDTVVTMVAEHEVAAGTRTNKRDKKHTALRTCFGPSDRKASAAKR